MRACHAATAATAEAVYAHMRMPLTRAMHWVVSSESYQARTADRSLHFLYCSAVLRALGSESNNVTFLIRLYVSNTARSCACLAFKFSSPQRTKQRPGFGANPSNGHCICICACACAFAGTPHVLLRLLDSDSDQTIEEGEVQYMLS